MPASYSYDLRQKAVEAVKRGEKKIEVSRIFKISRNTLNLWLTKEKETGYYQACIPSAKGTKPKISDLDKLRDFVKENSDKTQKQMAELWVNNVTQQNISYACQKLGITRKKKLCLSRKRRRKKDKISEITINYREEKHYLCR